VLAFFESGTLAFCEAGREADFPVDFGPCTTATLRDTDVFGRSR